MKKLIKFLFSSFVIVGAAWAAPFAQQFDITIAIVNEPEFVPLHKYYMAPSGCSDSNNGTSPATPWCTPNHNVVCGDVIIAVPGVYNQAQFGRKWGTVSNCPSTTGGIDGAGGIYFAIVLCNGDLAACTISTGTSGTPPTLIEWYGGQSNWAVEGFNIPAGGGRRAFGIRTVDNNCNIPYKSHHIASINNIVSNSMQGFGFNDCGVLRGTANAFADYTAAVGMIVQNANQNGNFERGICVGAIDMIGLGNWDNAAGTHTIIYNNYGIANQTTGCGSMYDGHAFYIDSPNDHLWSAQGVISNNIAYMSTRTCIALTSGSSSAPPVVFKIYNNTCFNNNAGITGTDGSNGEIATNTGSNNAPWTVTVINNIAHVDHPHAPNGAALYAVNGWFSTPITLGAVGGNGQENVFKGGGLTSCERNFGSNRSCDPGFNVLFNNQTLPAGSNFYVNPQFTNTADLLANRMGVPNCAGFTTTTACMGWDAKTGTLTTPSVISDLIANCAQCAGKGFQRPSINCVASNPDYPTWLKGVVHLEVRGSKIVQALGLATRPCGL